MHAIKIPADVEKLLSKYTCLACHKADQRLVGPALKIAAWINSITKKHG